MATTEVDISEIERGDRVIFPGTRGRGKEVEQIVEVGGNTRLIADGATWVVGDGTKVKRYTDDEEEPTDG